jgi:uncharacterized membrane protein (Fun14 family)
MKLKVFFLILIMLFSFSVINAESDIVSDGAEPESKTIETQEQNDIDGFLSNTVLWKIVTMLGFGGLCGFVTGFAVNRIARIFAFVLGVIFIAVQFFAFKGWITVDWNAIAHSTNFVNEEAFTSNFKSLLAMLTNNLPFGGSFLAGFFLGIKKR